MAQCAYCKAETETCEGGDVPICLECLDARQAKLKPPAAEQVGRLLIQESVEATSRANAALRSIQRHTELVPERPTQPGWNATYSKRLSQTDRGSEGDGAGAQPPE